MKKDEQIKRYIWISDAIRWSCNVMMFMQVNVRSHRTWAAVEILLQYIHSELMGLSTRSQVNLCRFPNRFYTKLHWENEWFSAHRCCSTVAAGWCCHTGSHTKRSSPTSSLPLFLFLPSSSPALPPLSRLLCPPFTPLRLFFTPSPLLLSPTFTFTFTDTHLYLPQLPLYSPAPASPPAPSCTLSN